MSPYMSSVKLLPDASATVPSVAVMVPELRTPGATSAAKPPLEAVIVPLLTIDASGRPGMLKLYRPAMKSAFLMSLVVARKPAVFTTLPGPNRMPSRLMTNTRPLAVNVPMISDGPRPPVTRLSATDELFGWLKRTLSLARMLNVFQLMIALLLDWLMITDAPPWPWMVAAPPTTVPPSGPAAAGVKPSGRSAQ